MVKVSEITPYVIPKADVNTGDIITILSGIRIRPKTETGFDRDTCEITVKLPNGKEKPMTINRTSQRKIAAEYGDESDGWSGKKAVVTIALMVVRGSQRDVIYLDPIKQEPKKRGK